MSTREEIIEKAAKALHDSHCKRKGHYSYMWDHGTPEGRRTWFEDAEAALIAVGHIEPLPAPTPGQVIAEQLYIGKPGDAPMFCWRTSPFGGLGLFEGEKTLSGETQQARLEEVRKHIAAAIDHGISEALAARATPAVDCNALLLAAENVIDDYTNAGINHRVIGHLREAVTKVHGAMEGGAK